MPRDKLIIKELNLSAEKVAEINHIITTEHRAKRNDRIRAALGCNLCCVCAQIPSHQITYNLDGVVRHEAYCFHCFTTIYEKNKDIKYEDLAELHGCIKAKEKC